MSLPSNCYSRARVDCFSRRFDWKLAGKSIATKDGAGYYINDPLVSRSTK